jgi:flavin-binding protein dodecin
MSPSLACLARTIQAYSPPEGTRMVEKTIELTGTSTNSIEDAVGLAIARAAATIKGIKPEVEVDRITAVVEDGGVTAWRVRVKVSFAVQEQIHE